MDVNNFRAYTTEHGVCDLGEVDPNHEYLTVIKAELCLDGEHTGFDVAGRDKEPHEKTIGSTTGYRIKRDAMNRAGYHSPDDIFDVADDESQDLTDIFSVLLDKCFLETVATGDIIVIDRVVVNERYRGHDFGLKMIQKILGMHDYSFASLLVAPTDHLISSMALAKKKLMLHYARVGFERIKGTSVMVLPKHKFHEQLKPKMQKVPVIG